MDSLGNKFQTARESQGLTLGQMVSRTRIQEPHLKALEEGSFEQLPERVFTKGFVRAYARSLDLDEEECLRLFAECSASFYQKEGEGLPKFFLLKEDKHKGRTSRVMVVLLVVGLFLLGGLVLLQQQSPSTSIFSRFRNRPLNLATRCYRNRRDPVTRTKSPRIARLLRSNGKLTLQSRIRRQPQRRISPRFLRHRRLMTERLRLPCHLRTPRQFSLPRQSRKMVRWFLNYGRWK